MAEKHESILAAMKKAGKPMKPGEMADSTGIDQKEVSKIIDALSARSDVDVSRIGVAGVYRTDQ